MDNNPGSEAIARERISAAGLCARVRTALADVREYAAPFDVGVALHACGEATDLALAAATRCRAAAFAVVPCCVGKLSAVGEQVALPRSRAAREAGVTRQEFIMLARAADVHTVPGIERGGGTREQRRRRLAKTAVEMDRMAQLAEDHRYCTHMMLLQPMDASAKNDIAVGFRAGGGPCPYCAHKKTYG